MKSKKKPKNDANKIHVCISLSREIHANIKKIGVNLSSFVERTLNWLYSNVTAGNIQILSENTLILSPDLKNTLKNEWTRPDLNRRPPPCQGDVIAKSDSENKPKLSDLKISTPPRKTEETAALLTMGELYRQHETEFKEFCLSSSSDKIDEGTYKDYASALKRFGASICVPVDVTEYNKNFEIYLPDKVGKGWGKFTRMLNRKLPPEERKLNGFPFSDFKEAFNDAEAAASKDNIAQDLTPSQMKAFVANVPEDCKVLFQILAYSGARLEQAVNAFGSGKLRELSETVTTESGKKVFRINVSEFGEERKRTNYYYLPVEFAETALNWRPSITTDSYSRKLSIAGAAANPPDLKDSKKVHKVVSAKTLRKWLINAMIKNDVPAEVAGWIEGRVPNKNTSAAAITWRHYTDLDALAAEAYGKMESVILSVLPIDSKFGTAEAAADAAPKEKKARSDKKEVDYEKMRALLKAGVSQSAVAKACNTNKTRVNQFVKENPDCRNSRNRNRSKAPAEKKPEPAKPAKHKVSKDLLKLGKK